jgi:hypothetical protein
MSAPLYARYVPPKPSKITIQLPQPISNSTENIYPSPTPQLYARYIPPKATQRVFEPAVGVYSKKEAVPTESSLTKSTSKKRKRPEENYAHEDRKALINSFSQTVKSSEHDASGGELEPKQEKKIKKDKKDKKDKERKRMKSEAMQPALESRETLAEPPQGTTARPPAANSILAKYSITGGTRRTANLDQRSKTVTSEPMNMDEVDEDGVHGDDTNVDASRGQQDNDGSQQSEGSDEEITPAGVKAIFQKYRKSTQPTSKVRRVKKKQENEAINAEEPEPELHGRFCVASQKT